MNTGMALIGVGEMGGVFARGLLRNGHPVYPITRQADMERELSVIPEVEALIVAVGEKDLHAVLADIPESWRDRLVLLQNELLPRDWRQHQITNPTVISVWFEKKQPADYKVIIPSPVYGPHARIIADALGAINIPCRVLSSAEELLFELVVKNLYILTTNIAGLKVGGNVGELWEQHQPLARKIAQDILDIQFHLIEAELDREQLIEAMVNAFQGDPAHKCMGRSAPARLQRALEQAAVAGLGVPTLHEVSNATA